MATIEIISTALECIPRGKNCVILWVYKGKLWSETVYRTEFNTLISYDVNGKAQEFEGFHKDQELTVYTLPELH